MVLILIISFLFDHPFVHLGTFALIMSAGFYIGISGRRLFTAILPLLPIMLMIVLFTGFTGPDSLSISDNTLVLLRIGEYLVLTTEGLKLGLTFLFRLINMVVMTTLLLATTDLDDFIQLFHKLKLPYNIAFTLTTALRFIPELEMKRKLIIEAQTARGADLESGSFIRRYYLQISIMLPLIVNAIVMADKLNIALLSRGFGYRNHWTDLHEIKLTAKDVGIILFCLIACALSIVVRLKSGWGRL